MRYCRIETENGPQYAEVVEQQGEPWVVRLIPAPPEDRSVERMPAEFGAQPLAWCKVLAPVTPSKIVCIGRNYRDHAAELGNEVPKEPLLFLKAPSAVIGPGEPIRLPAISQRVDFEGELGIVIGKRCSRLGAEEDFRPYIRGYVCVNDVTARDLQKSDGQWSRAKGFDTFCPVGPWVTDEMDAAAGIAVRTHLNGEARQNGSTADLIFNIGTLLRYITASMTLLPGDLIPTGTPAGVGAMKAGDVVVVSAEGCGELGNPVVAGS